MRALVVALALLALTPATARAAQTGGATPPGTSPAPAATITPAPPVATVAPDGLAVAPAGAPPQVVAAIAAANLIARRPYVYGGGHAAWVARGYDCSGSVSFALHGAGLLAAPLDSTGLERWGAAGPGLWITVYANRGHAFAIIAGLRFDTSGRTTAGTRWQASSRPLKGYVVRHPAGL